VDEHGGVVVTRSNEVPTKNVLTALISPYRVIVMVDASLMSVVDQLTVI
jgi:hypothetical protein